MIKQEKYLYCENCKEYPDEIIEDYSGFAETRKWNGECYELETSDIEGAFQASRCPKCLNELIEK